MMADNTVRTNFLKWLSDGIINGSMIVNSSRQHGLYAEYYEA